jgi:hypothetical protein
MWGPRRLKNLWGSTACYRVCFIFLPHVKTKEGLNSLYLIWNYQPILNFFDIFKFWLQLKNNGHHTQRPIYFLCVTNEINNVRNKNTSQEICSEKMSTKYLSSILSQNGLWALRYSRKAWLILTKFEVLVRSLLPRKCYAVCERSSEVYIHGLKV